MNKLDGLRDPEVIGSPLNLHRPELLGVHNRYMSRSALIVGRSVDETTDLKAALVNDGWRVISCDGPAHVGCPLLQRRGPCPKRVSSDVAVVYVATASSVASSLPLVRCAADPSSPGVVTLEGQADEAMIDGDRALVGALRTGRTIADTVHAIAGTQA